MARPWIEFLFSQQLSWREGLYGGARDDVLSKVLSIDKDYGDSSTLVFYPPGWIRKDAHVLTCEEEFLVLDGEININGVSYLRDCYANLPASYVRDYSFSKLGCTALTFFDSTPKLAEPPSSKVYDDQNLIEYMNLMEMDWDTSVADPALIWMGNRRKVLKKDKRWNQNSTFLFSTPPHIYPDNWVCPTLTHPCVEETFVLAGEFIGPCGRMAPGAYFWRPEGKPHGPFGTREGGLSLIRFKYGRHINEWGNKPIQYSYDFPYKPILPAELAYLGDQYYSGIDRF